MDSNKFGIGIEGYLEKAKTEKRLKADVKTLKEINVPLTGKLSIGRTKAQLKEDIKSVTGTVNLTAKANKKGLSTSVKDIVKQAQEIVNKNSIKLNIGGIDNKKLDDIIVKLKQLSHSSNTIDTSESVNAINREAQAMLEIIDNARKAALEKLEFAEANREVRESAEHTADAIIRERNAMESMDNINYILANVNMNAEQGESVFRRFGNTLNEAFATYTIANLLEDAIYEIIDAGREGIEVVKELNDVATSLRMATGGSLEETNALVDSYNDLGQELGAITRDVSESADAWLRQGHSISDTNTLIADSMMLSKIANLNSAESTEYLTSIMQAYRLTAEEVVDIVSKLSAVDLESASDAGGLAKAMSRCASAAKMAGVSMDILIGYISTVKEVTQDSDEAVGNMFKSIFSRMNQIRAGKFVDLETGESLNDTEKVLNEIGIVTRDLNNQLIDSEQIIDSIGKGWSKYDKNTRKALATAIAGTYQYNKFLSLMDSYSDAMNYANISANSKGTAEEKFGYYLESLESKTNSLQASLENLATTTFSDELYASVLDTSKAVVDLVADTGALKGLLIGLGTSGALYGFQQITHSLGDITQGFANLNEAMNMTRGGAVGINDMQRLIDLTGRLSQSQTRLLLSTNNLTDAQKIAILMNQGLTQAEAQQAIQTWGVVTAQNGATVATISFTGALRGLFATLMSNPLVLVTTLISAGVMAFDAYNRKIEETKQQFADLKSEVSQIESELSSLNTELQTTVDRMNELESKDSLTFTEKSELDNLVKQNNELQRKIDLLELEQKTKNKALNKAFVDTMVSDAQDQFEYTKDDASNVFKGNSAWYGMSGASVSASDEKEFIEYQFALHKEYSEKMAQLNAEIVGATEERKAEIKEEIESLETSIDEIETYLSSKNTEFSTNASEIHYISNPTTEDDEAVNAWLDYIADFQDRMAIAMGGTNAKENAFNRVVDNWQFDETTQGLQDLGEQAKVTAEMLDDPKYDAFIAKLVELGVIDSADNLEDVALAFNKITDATQEGVPALAEFTDVFNTDTLTKASEEIDNIQNAYKTLNDAINEYNSVGSFSIDTLQSILALGSDWLDYLVDEDGNLKLDKESLEQLTQARLNDMKMQIINNMIDNVSKIETDAQANEYLKLTNYELAESYDAVTVAALSSAKAKLQDAVASGTLTQKNMDATVSSLEKDIKKTNKLFKNVDFGVSSMSGTSSAKDTAKELEKETKEVLESQLKLYEAELNAGLISFDEFLGKSRTLLDQYYADGKIKASDYYGYIEDLEKQRLSIMDKVISAVTRRYDREIDSIQKTIDTIKKQNEALEKQKDEYDKVLSVVESVYDAKIDSIKAEQDAIDDTIDKLRDENDEKQRQINLEQARWQLYQSLNNRNVKLFNGKEFVYTTNADEVRDAQQNLADLELENTIVGLEKEKEALDAEIEALELYKQKWAEISTAYETETNKQLAIAIWGKDYEKVILSNRTTDIESFKNNYIATQKQIENNQGLIDSYNEKIEYYELLKEQWQSISDAYDNAQEDLLASQVLGANWEADILSGRLDVLNNFKNQYIAIEQAIANAAWNSANEQNKAKASIGTGSTNGSAGSVGDGSNPTPTMIGASSPSTKFSTITGINTTTPNVSTIRDFAKNPMLKYGEGTDNAKPGVHQISENGDEIVVDNHGNAVLAKGKQLHAFEGGETVIKASESSQLLHNQGNFVPIQTWFENMDMSKLAQYTPSITPNIHVPTYDFSHFNRDVGASINIGDIHIHKPVGNVDSFADAIIREFPNKMNQRMNIR